MNRLNELRRRIESVELLRRLKKRNTYAELSKRTGVSIALLNRYVKGHVLPNLDRAEHFFELFAQERDIRKEILKRISFGEDGYFDNTLIISNPLLMRLIAEEAYKWFKDVKIDKILTIAADGIPLAAFISRIFGVSFIFAKKRKEVGVKNFVEETYTSDLSGTLTTIYLPKNSLQEKEKVLIVDDVLRDGKNQISLINLTEKVKSKVKGMFVVLSIGDMIKQLKSQYNFPIKSLIHISRPSDLEIKKLTEYF